MVLCLLLALILVPILLVARRNRFKTVRTAHG